MLNKNLDEESEKLQSAPAIIKMVRIIDTASLSILELLEFGITQKEINHAIARNVIRFDKSVDSITNTGDVTSDYYFHFLNSKVKLTDLGLFILQQIKK